MKDSILHIFACPSCGGKLTYEKKKLQLVCQQESLAYPVNDGIPVLIEKESMPLSVESEEN